MTIVATKVARRRARRCSACGHRLAVPAPPACDLCGFQLDDNSTIGADVTPYARAYSVGERGWWRMCEWVWFASGDRIRHAALMRASAASRRFAQINCLMLALAMTLFHFPQVGWHSSLLGDADPATGNGWTQVAALPLGRVVQASTPTQLWWNFPQSALAGSLGLISATLTIWLTMLLIRACVEGAHRSGYRGEYRMTAALHYCTAWVFLVLAGAWLLGSLPLAHAGTIAQWGWCPSAASLQIAGGALSGIGVLLGWFWLVRVSASAPVRTRTRVVTFFSVGLPLIVVGVAVGWHLGMIKLYDLLMPLFDLNYA